MALFVEYLAYFYRLARLLLQLSQEQSSYFYV